MLQMYIARHGQNEDNANGILNGHRDMPLTELGRQQAKKLAEEIKHLNLALDAIYTSPLVRASETAEIVADALGLPKPEVVDSLQERDFGIMTGRPVKDIEKLCEPDILKAGAITYFLSPEGAETFPTLLARAQWTIADIKERHQDGSILLVTHGDLGKMLYAAYYRLPREDALTLFHFGNSSLLLLSEASKAEETHIIRFEESDT